MGAPPWRRPTPVPVTAVPAVVYVHGGGWVQGDSAITSSSLVGQVASAIEARFGIRYDQDHVGRLMHKYGLRNRRFVYAPVAVYTSTVAATASA